MKRGLLHKLLILGAVLLVPLVAQDAFAISLQDAKAKGYIGERPNGYLGLVDASAPADAKATMDDINGKRRAEYASIAKRNGTEVSAVEALAGQKAIEMTPSGQFIQQPDGSWKKK